MRRRRGINRKGGADAFRAAVWNQDAGASRHGREAALWNSFKR